MLLLAVGDLHYKGEESRGRKGNKLQTDLLREKLLRLVRKRKPKIVVLLGDTFDRFSHVDTLPLQDAHDLIYELGALLEKWEGRLYVLIGNHDLPGANYFLSKRHPLTGIRNQKNIVIVDEPTRVSIEELEGDLLFVPYVPPGRFQDAIDKEGEREEEKEEKIDEEEKEKNKGKKKKKRILCIFAHQEFRG